MLATDREGETATEDLGVVGAKHAAHGEPEGSMMPELESLELSTPATERVEAPRHQVRSPSGFAFGLRLPEGGGAVFSALSELDLSCTAAYRGFISVVSCAVALSRANSQLTHG